MVDVIFILGAAAGGVDVVVSEGCGIDDSGLEIAGAAAGDEVVATASLF